MYPHMRRSVSAAAASGKPAAFTLRHHAKNEARLDSEAMLTVALAVYRAHEKPKGQAVSTSLTPKFQPACLSIVSERPT